MAHLIILHIVRDHSLTKTRIPDKLRAYTNSAVSIASSLIITYEKKIIMKLIDNFISILCSYYTST